MRFKSVETTPNPNSMKLNFHDTFGETVTYSSPDEGCPALVSHLLDIEGVASVFVCHDFITLNKEPQADWKTVLVEAKQVLGAQSDDDERGARESTGADEPMEGQVQVFAQVFKGIHMQIKVVDKNGESRVSCGERFNQAAMSIQQETGDDLLKERIWEDLGVRYGDRDEIAEQVADEITGTIGEEELSRLVDRALGRKVEDDEPDVGSLEQQLQSEDWHIRLAALDRLSQKLKGERAVSILAEHTEDEHAQVRRLVAAALGATEELSAVSHLCRMLLTDRAAGVRRTAGDALSDIGDRSAQEDVSKALGDSNRLVRWRAARFLFEVGTRECLPALEKVADDPEFEVQLEVRAAIKRIEEGKEGSVPVWKQISNME